MERPNYRREWPVDDDEFIDAFSQAEAEANAGDYAPNDAFIEDNQDAFFRYCRLMDRMFGIDESVAPAKGELGPQIAPARSGDKPSERMRDELGQLFGQLRR